jgi:hypothetical protein
MKKILSFSTSRVGRLMKNSFFRLYICTIPIAFIFSCETTEVKPTVDDQALFLDFATNGQTLPTFIHTSDRTVAIEVDHDVDVTELTPTFEIPEGYEVFANGVKQTSGISKVDFSKPVTYQLKNAKTNTSTTWQAEAAVLSCKILIDASHDGGVWWFPQGDATGFNPDQPHQGKAFADALREKGFEVTELGRGKELTEETFFGHYIVIRVNGFQAYTANELKVYTNLTARGMNLVFITDHKKNDPIDELGDHLGLQFKGVAKSYITNFAEHEITTGIESIYYNAGSVLVNVDENPDIEVLAWLDEDVYADLNFNGVQDDNEQVGAPVMGVLHYPKSRIFFVGDMNGIEVQPQPFINNLIGWMGSCAAW